jgi:hypothetical protein
MLFGFGKFFVLLRPERARIFWDRQAKDKIIDIKNSHWRRIPQRYIKVVYDEGVNDELAFKKTLKKKEEMKSR